MNRSSHPKHGFVELSIRTDHPAAVDEENCDDEPASPVSETYSETIDTPKQNLTMWDVAALILNKQIGGGIFTTAGPVLKLTNSKTLALVLWALGGVYCALCLVIYLDFGTALPFNGGELIYLNKVWEAPEFLSAVLFAGFFISLGHTAGNAVASSRLMLLASKTTPQHDGGEILLDSRLVKIFAIVTLGVVCLLLWITPKMGMFLNRALASYKILLLLVIGFAGIGARNNPNSGLTSWNQSNNSSPNNALCNRTSSNGTSSDGASSDGASNTPSILVQHFSSLIYIVYSYGGWENANYIIGDIHTKTQDLRNGAFTAVTIVTFLYVLVNIGYFMACETQVIITGSADLGFVLGFTDQVFGCGHEQAIQINVAICAVGNLIAVAYTGSKVKQAVALHHFLPYSTFFAKDDTFDTPGPALLLHWICSSIVIIFMENTSDGYTFIIGLYSYGQLVIGLFIGMGFPRLRRALRDLRPGDWEPLITHQWARWVLGLVLTISNFVVLGFAASAKDPGTIPRFWWAVVLCIVLIVSFLWWLGLVGLQGSWGEKIGWTAKVVDLRNVRGFVDMDRKIRRDGAEKKFVYTLLEDKPLAKIKHWMKPMWKWLVGKLF